MLATLCYEREAGIRYENAIARDAMPQRVLRAYYFATAVFLLLDYFADLNVRVAFLDDAPGLRAAYYGFCALCLALMLWRPAWTAVISAFESLVTLASLIIATGVRAILVTDPMLDGTDPTLSMQEIVNFLLAGGIAYLAWTRGLKRLHEDTR